MARETEIHDRHTVTDVICAAMHDLYRDWSIDVLLTWPNKAKALGEEVCRRLHRKPTDQEIHEILRAALAARKRGDLKRDAV